jgi:putative ATP-dependent endonuclease of the OLD family
LDILALLRSLRWEIKALRRKTVEIGEDFVRVTRLKISNFRGVADGVADFGGHTLLVGGNNVGKSTVCEALDLVLGPERLFRRPVIDEHDFYCGRYLDADGNPAEVRIDAVLIELSACPCPNQA